MSATWLLPKTKFDHLIALLQGDGFEVIGPRIDQGAIVYGPVRCADELPIGWTDRQAPGSYRLEQRADRAYFGYAVGPHSWKKYLFPPLLRLWQARRNGQSFEITAGEPEPPRRAFLGVRACELKALAVQDLAFINRAGQWSDPHYAQARARLFLVAVECEVPGGTCFCTSMGTGPEINGAATFDLALTELDDAFVLRTGSPAGEAARERLQLAEASVAQVEQARDRVAAAAQAMGRSLDTTGIQGLLQRNPEHPRWEQVADRCLACTNCTLVCPTCFCSSVQDSTDLTLDSAERVRRWDSCFNPDFAQVHGGNFRPSIQGRYRQWLTHKFSSWFDQFGVSGCVGCGRCITWCPVGIDVTEEITAIRAADGARKEGGP
jgi:sulfhydrogenase subunit beta (sulfur reductase)